MNGRWALDDAGHRASPSAVRHGAIGPKGVLTRGVAKAWSESPSRPQNVCRRAGHTGQMAIRLSPI